jgi:flagellar hook-associated protein 2
VTVQNLASSEQHTLVPTALDGHTKLTVTAGSASKDYTYASIDDLVSQINADDQGSAYAVNVNGSLVLSRRVTGAAQGFTVAVDDTDLVAGQDETIKAGQDAHYTVDGGSVQSSSSNVVANGLPGVQLTLKTTGTSTVNVQPPTVDPAGIKAKIKAFVSAYNASVDLVRGKLNEKPVANPQNDSDAVKGVLYGDQTLSSVLSQMRQTISAAGLDSLGVTVPGTGSGTSDDALAGKLSFNEATFDDAWAKSPSAVQAKLGSTTTSGFAQTFEGLLDPITRAGDGLLDQRVNQANSDLAYIKDTLAAMDLRLQSKEDYLRAQFTAMESALAQSQSQSSWLAGQLAQSS